MQEPASDHQRQTPAPAGTGLIIPALAVALAVYYLISTAELSWEARSAGLFVGSILLVLCALQLLRSGRSLAAGRAAWGFAELFRDSVDNRRRLGLLLLVVLFIAAIEWVGVTLGLFLLIAGSMAVMGVRHVRQLVLVPGITALTVFVLLVWLLGTRLPKGPFEAAILPLLGTS